VLRPGLAVAPEGGSLSYAPSLLLYQTHHWFLARRLPDLASIETLEH
jgi:hypothetical protein